ncbi:MAG: hypothetical protein J6A51_04515, partial [Clostridia bacterium]|nr:hypothetical protein [Clostridia bacterium]
PAARRSRLITTVFLNACMKSAPANSRRKFSIPTHSLAKIPSSIKFDAVEDEAYPIFYEQSAEVCFSNTNNAKKSQRKSNVAPSAQPQKVCLFKKVYWYYKVHGFKACVKRVFTKIFGGKNEK